MPRVTPHHGGTALKTPANEQGETHIDIIYDAEVKDLPCCARMCLLCCCKSFSQERSYLYVRENSIEKSIAIGCCLCPEEPKYLMEHTEVWYYDMPPFRPGKAKCCFCCIVPCSKTEPKLDIVEEGCWCCCQRIVCCSRVVIMPFEVFPFPCCCCSNRTSHNCCNCWACFKCNGPLEGVPKMFSSFSPQPENPWDFLQAYGKATGQEVRTKPGGDLLDKE